MSLSVTSHFNFKMLSTNPTSMVHVFTLASSDFTSRALKYGSVSRDATDVIGGNWKVTVENASQLFNDLYVDKTKFLQDATYDFGYSTESATNETVQLFGGVFIGADYNESKVVLSFRDKLAQLQDKKIGSKESPVTFTNTNVSAADLGWWIVTSHGGLSAIQSTSNPDINYATFVEWQTAIDADSIVVNANFTGEDLPDTLDVLQRLTDSVIYAEGDNKIYFNRWTGAASLDTVTIADSDTAGKIKLSLKASTIVNKVDVLIGYNPTSDTWLGTVTEQNTTSVNTFGAQELIFDDTSIWLPTSATALNLAQRITYRRAEPNRQFTVPTPLKFLNIQLGDEVAFTSRVYSLDDETFTLQGYTVDTENKEQTITLDEGFGQGAGRLRGFVLDDAVWGLLDQDYNPLL